MEMRMKYCVLNWDRKFHVFRRQFSFLYGLLVLVRLNYFFAIIENCEYTKRVKNLS